jgi:hypothetical protein
MTTPYDGKIKFDGPHMANARPVPQDKVDALAKVAAAAMTKEGLLDAAKAAVADRGLNYGSPEDNFGRIAELWQTHLRNRGQREIMIQDFDVAMMMVLMKVARLENDPSHLDSWTDVAGYAACGATLKKDA